MIGLTTGKLAKEANVNTETLRYYERRGLLPEPPRRESGYRMYPPQSIERLRFIKGAQALGFTLDEIRELLDLRVDENATQADVRELAKIKAVEIEAKIEALTNMRAALLHLSLRDFVLYIGDMIADRRAFPRDDLISGLVHAEEEGERLSEQELFSMIALLIVAGHETTVNLIGNGLLALLQHPDQMALLRRKPELIESAIEEFLRYDGPVEMATMRYAAEDVEIGETLIRRGTPIVVVLAAVNRDPSIFTDAAALDITREANKHLGFGYGVHYCLGAPLARLEARIAFDTLLKRIPTMRLSVPSSQLRYNDSTVVHGLIQLPVCWKVESRYSAA